MTKIIAEVGSCHDGERKKAFELIDMCTEAGANAVKFQLLTEKETRNGNVELDWKWFPDLVSHGNKLGIEVFASVFNEDGIKWLTHCGCKSIKFSYSQIDLIRSGAFTLDAFDKIYMSTDVMRERLPGCINLYCIPLYPVPYIIDFEGIFPKFDGFSSHTLGISQDISAMAHGAKYIEKHVKGDWDSPCPDAKFAINMSQLRTLCDAASPSVRARRAKGVSKPVGQPPKKAPPTIL